MARVLRPAETTRSEHWLRVAVNDRPDALDAAVRGAFGWGDGEAVEWVSPMADDDFAEYSDGDFLARLGITDPPVPLREFWPKGGPRWDTLARTASGKLLLVEAKAHVEEMVDGGTAASPDSLALIRSSLEETQRACGATPGCDWSRTLYQYANRLAHLHYLAGRCGLDAYLLFLNFADAPDVPRPTSAAEWAGAHRLASRVLGLPSEPFGGRVRSAPVAVADLSGPA